MINGRWKLLQHTNSAAPQWVSKSKANFFTVKLQRGKGCYDDFIKPLSRDPHNSSTTEDILPCNKYCFRIHKIKSPAAVSNILVEKEIQDTVKTRICLYVDLLLLFISKRIWIPAIPWLCNCTAVLRFLGMGSICSTHAVKHILIDTAQYALS